MQPHKKQSLLTDYDAKLFGILLLPSWLSAILSAFISAAVIAGAVTLSRYQGSNLHLYILNYRAGRTSTNYGMTSSTGLLSNPIIGNLPLMIFWGLIGLVVYMFAANIFGVLRESAEFRNELNYVNADRHELFFSAATHVVVRLIVLALWLPYILIFFHHLLPYAIATALAGSAQASLTASIPYFALSFMVLYAALYVHTILFRLLLLRPRISSKSIYL